jgi:hypothetical protein
VISLTMLLCEITWSSKEAGGERNCIMSCPL